MKKIFEKEWVAWVFLVICIIFNITMGCIRAPRLIKDSAGLLSSGTEKRIEEVEEVIEDKYDTRVGVAFVKTTNNGIFKKTANEFIDYYWEKLDLGDNDAMFIFICRDGKIQARQKYGKEYKRFCESGLAKEDYTFKLLNDNFVDDIIEAYENNGDRDTEDIDGVTSSFYENVEKYFREVTCPAEYDEWLAAQNSNNIAGTVENAVSGLAGFIKSIITSIVGRISFSTVIIIIVIVAIIKRKSGGVSNRLG